MAALRRRVKTWEFSLIYKKFGEILGKKSIEKFLKRNEKLNLSIKNMHFYRKEKFDGNSDLYSDS